MVFVAARRQFDLQENIECIKLSPRTQCVLAKLDVHTVDQLLHLNEGQLARIRLVGDDTRTELCSTLTLYLNVTAIDAVEQSVKTAHALSERVLVQYQSLITGLRRLFWARIGRAVARGSMPVLKDDEAANVPRGGGTSLKLLQLSVRSYNGLMRAGVTTIEQLLSLRRDEILAIRQIGSKSMSEIEACVTNLPAGLVRDRPALAQMFAVSPFHTSGEVKCQPCEVALMQEPVPDSGLLTEDDRVWLIQVVLNALRDPDIKANSDLTDLDYLVSRFIEVLFSDQLLPEATAWLRRNYPNSFLFSEPPMPSLASVWPQAVLDLSCSAVELPLDDIPIARLALPPDVAAVLKASEIQSLASLLTNWDRMGVGSSLLQGLSAAFISWLLDQPRRVWAEEAQGAGRSPVYKLVLQDVCAEDLLKRWVAPLRSERHRQIVLLRYGVEGSQLAFRECAMRYGITEQRVKQVVHKAETELPSPSSYAEISVAAGLGEAMIREAGGIVSEVTLAKMMEPYLTFGRLPRACVFRLLFMDQSKRLVQETRLKAWRLAEFPSKVAKQINELVPAVQQGKELTISELQELIQKTDLYNQDREILTPEFIELCSRFYGVQIRRERRASSAGGKLEPMLSGVHKRKPTSLVTIKPRSKRAVARKRDPTPSVVSKRFDHETSFDKHLISALKAIRRAAHYEEIAELVSCKSEQARIRLNSRSDLFRSYGLGFYGLEEWERGW
jgi:hypothetical protein